MSKRTPKKPKAPEVASEPVVIDDWKKIDERNKRLRSGEQSADYPTPVLASAFLREKALPAEWIAEGLFERGKITAIGGVPGSGKTAVVLAGLVAAARAGHKVLLVELEGSRLALQKKLELGGLESRYQGNVGIIYGQSVDLSTDGWKEHFLKLTPKYQLVVLDTIADVQSVDLLDATALGEWLKWLRDAAVLPMGLTVAFTAHAPKATATYERAPLLADLFGSQVIGGKIDNCFICRDLKPRGKDATSEDEDQHHWPLKEFHNVKLREGELFPTRTGRISETLTGVLKADGTPHSVGIWHWQTQSPGRLKADMRFVKTSERLLKLLRGLEVANVAPKNISAFWNACKEDRPGRKEVFIDATKKLMKRGEIFEDGEGLLRCADRSAPPADASKNSETPSGTVRSISPRNGAEKGGPF